MDRAVWLDRLFVVAAACIALFGIASLGIWDPWELGPAGGATLASDLLARGELAARFPNALGGLLLAALTYGALQATVGNPAGAIGVTVLASTPLFLLNARLAMGDASGMAAQAWVGVTALGASASHMPKSRRVGLYALLALGITTSAALSGVLLGPLPPLLAVAVWGIISRGRGQSVVARWLYPLVSVFLVAGVIHAVVRDSPEPTVWLGGGAVGGDPPTWDEALVRVFHGFAPWSTALPVALGWAMRPSKVRSARAQRAAAVFVLWLGFGFASWTVFASRYGTPPWLATLPLGAVVALWLAELGGSRKPHWPAAVTVALLSGLLIRDYALYPESALRVLAGDAIGVPEEVQLTSSWATVFACANGLLCLFLVSPTTTPRPKVHDTIRWLREQQHAPWPRRGWILLLASLLGACIVFGAMCWILDLPIASVVLRGGRVAFFTPLALAALIFGLPWAQHLFGRLGRFRMHAALVGGLVFGAFVALRFQPALGRHFSPKPVFEAYATLADSDAEPLVAYRTPTAAARYYTEAQIQEIEERDALIDYLRGADQRWAVIPADELGRVDRAYRRATGHHVYVADARSARLLLVAANPLPNRPNQSFIAAMVYEEPPAIEHEVTARFEDRVELLGYDLDLPDGDSVGAGQQLGITWYWRVLGRAPTGYEVFVHIDGNGLRLNGDHEPAGGRYPAKLWEAGDIVADAQKLTVPPNFGPGDYVIYCGWYRGDERIPVTSGPNDGMDRARVGVLKVR